MCRLLVSFIHGTVPPRKFELKCPETNSNYREFQISEVFWNFYIFNVQEQKQRYQRFIWVKVIYLSINSDCLHQNIITIWWMMKRLVIIIIPRPNCWIISTFCSNDSLGLAFLSAIFTKKIVKLNTDLIECLFLLSGKRLSKCAHDLYMKICAWLNKENQFVHKCR